MLKRLALFGAAVAGLFPALQGQPVPPSPVPALPTPPATTASTRPGAGPQIQFADLAHDFGKVEAGAVLKHDFVFTNTGDAPLEITEVRPGCGCTAAGAWDRRVEPGQTGRIPLQLNTTGFSGTLAKSATVACNASGQSNVFLQMKALIWRPIEITPPSVYFSVSAETATNDTRVLRILNNLETPLTLSPPECTNQAFRAELKTVREGKEFELHVTVQPPFTASYAQAPVTLKTSSTNTPLLSIPVSAHIQPVIMTIPSLISLPPGPLPAPLTPSLTIRNSGTNALVLSEPSINLEGVTLALKEVQPGRVFTLAINVPVGLQLQPTQRAEVTLKSNHPRFPVVKVPVIQQQRASVTAPLRSPPAVKSAPAVPLPPTTSRRSTPPPVPAPGPVPAVK